MGRYSNTGLAHGTNGAPQITTEENIYGLKMAKIIKNLSLNIKQANNNLIATSPGKSIKKLKRKENVLEKIIALILSLGYREIPINDALMYIKDGILIRITYIEEYDYFIIEKADSILNAENNKFELLLSISNELKTSEILGLMQKALNQINY